MSTEPARGTRPSGRDIHVQVSTPIAASPDRVWGVVGHRFADIANWSTTVRESRPLTRDEVGRSLVAPGAPVPGRETTSPAATLREVLIEWDEDQRTFTFDTLGLPRLLRQAQNRTHVEADGNGGAVVSFDIHIVAHPLLTPVASLLRRRMAHTFGRVQADLKQHVETGVGS